MMKPNGRWLAKRDQGFTLFEVVVAGFVAILFFLLVLQASSLGTVSKVQAQEASEVLSWLQKDVEAIKYAASTLNLTSVTVANQDSAKVYLANLNDDKKAFKKGNIVEFVTSNPDRIRYTIKNYNGEYLELSTKLKTSYPLNSIVRIVSKPEASITNTALAGSNIVELSNVKKMEPGNKLMFGGLAIASGSNISGGGTQVDAAQEIYTIKSVLKDAILLNRNLVLGLDATNTVNIDICNATNKSYGYGDALRDELIGVDESTDASMIMLDTSMTKTSKGKQYTIKRVMEPVDIPPYNMLQVRYETNPTLSSMISLDSFVNRIMPDIVFYCN